MEEGRLNEYFYPKIGTNGLDRNFDDCRSETSIQEKIDGSQLSFLVEPNGEVRFFNRGREIENNASDSVFGKATSLLSLFLKDKKDIDSFIFHGEAVTKLRHNKVVYARTPHLYFVLFDIQTKDTKEWLPVERVCELGKAIGLEVAEPLWMGTENPRPHVKRIFALMETGEIPSMLGGDVPEGVVVKNPRFIKKGKESATKIKVVRKEFQEQRSLKSKKSGVDEDPNAICRRIMDCFPREPRWDKGIQKMRERGADSLPYLIKIVQRDFKEECEHILIEYLKQELVPHLIKEFTRGLEEKEYK